MKILICPDKFKGSASALEITESIDKGIRQIHPNAKIVHLPIADGGEGFAQTAASVKDGRWIECETLDALHRPLTGRYFLSKETAYLDMAIASGLDKLDPQELAPLEAPTRGTGILIRHAIEVSQAKDIVIGLGGSATNDGGAGVAYELGARFYDENNQSLNPTPLELENCTRIDLSGLMELPPITAACDVNNPLLGSSGATAIYGPQKGVTDIKRFEAILKRLCEVAGGQEHLKTEGSGAAGGLAYGLLQYTNAELKPGFELVASMTKLEDAIADADYIITGEGSLDAQTLNGKGPHGVALMAARHQKPVFSIAGTSEAIAESYFTKSYSLIGEGYPLERCLSDTASLVTTLATQLVNEQIT